MTTTIKRIFFLINHFIDDLFFAQFIAAHTEGGDFKTAKKLVEDRYGKKK